MIDWDKVLHAPIQGAFGELVTYQPAAGAPLTVTGVYDRPFLDAELAGGTGVSTTAPVIGVQLSQFSLAPAQGDRLTVLRTGESFIVREVQPDSHGWAKLLLNVSP